MAKKGAKKGKETLVVASKVKAAIKSKKLLCSSELVAALSDRVADLLSCAASRAQANGRKTVKAQDL